MGRGTLLGLEARGQREKEKTSGDVLVSPRRYCYSESRARLKFQVSQHTWSYILHTHY